MTDSVGHCFDQHGTRFFETNLARGRGGVVHCKNVVAVHSDGWNAQRWASTCDTVSPVLVLSGRRDGVSVVAAVVLMTQIRIRVTGDLRKTYQKKIIGHERVAAKLNAACASPSDAAPSPK